MKVKNRKTKSWKTISVIMFMLVLSLPPVRLIAECAETATSSSGKLEGELFHGYCVTVDIRIVSCTVCECHYMGTHEDTGMEMTFVTGGTDDGCEVDWPLTVSVQH